MKTLYILRHGKSSWDHSGISDFDRPLLEKGVLRTEKIGEYLLSNMLFPELIISSPARRAKETATLISKKLDIILDFDEKFYLGNPESILNTIYSLDEELSSIMVVGHNPGLTSLIRELINPNYDWLPTSGLAIAKYDIESWINLPLSKPVSIQIITPKNL